MIPSFRSWKISSVGSYTFLLATIFVAELALMELGSSWLHQLSPLQAALMDAGSLAAVFSLLLLLFCLRLRTDGAGPPWGLFFRLLAIIFLVEFAVMLFLDAFGPRSSPEINGLLDATLTTALSACPLWWLLRRLERRHDRVDLAGYLKNPAMLYVLLLFLVFLADLQQELLLPIFFDDLDSIGYKMTDAVLTTLFISPILWLLVARPLRRLALSEQARTRAVYAQAIDAVITFDSRGLIECFNPGAENIFGCQAAAMIGRHASGLFDDGEEVFDRLLREPVSHATGSNRQLSYELLGRRSDGTLFPMDVSISKMLLQGEVEYLLILRDITERRLASEALRESESRFRQIFELTDDAIILLRLPDQSMIDINQVVARMFGYSPEELLEGGLERIFSPAEYRRVVALFENLIPLESLQLDQLLGLRKDGSELVLSLRVKGSTLGETEILYCTLRDVTDRVRLEAEARELQSKLIQANKMTSLGLMVSGVAHEINNPNNFILTNAQLLERSWQDACKILREYCRDNGDVLLGGIPFSQLDSHSAQLFSGMVDGSRRIREIVANLKGFARQETVALDHEVDINQVAGAAITILRQELARLTRHFHFEAGENLPRVLGNRHQLGQVVVNLLMNACQSLAGPDAEVRMRTYAEDESGQVVVEVRDSGVGIAADVAHRVMEPFYTTKQDAGGTGLGLSICLSIVKDHRGELEFQSEPGKGTVFFLKLPALGAENMAARR